MIRWWRFLRWLFGTPWPAYAFTMLQANLVGALFVFGFLRFALPLDSVYDVQAFQLLNQSLFLAYLAAAVIAGALLSLWLIYPVLVWQRSGAGKAVDARRRALHIPLYQALMHAALWSVGVVVFVSVNATTSAKLAIIVAVASILGGAATCLLSYLQAERMLRPIAAYALSHGVPKELRAPSVQRQILITGGLSIGIPLLGMLIVLTGLRIDFFENGTRIIDAMLVLLSAALIIGSIALTLVSSSIVDPLRQLQAQVSKVRDGDFSAKVHIYDASEIGSLQFQFNEMVKGLAERQHLRDMFGRYVGADVARRALEHGTKLGGEEREVGVLFVDLVGSTSLAMETRAENVVELLNKFFYTVVEVVDNHGGFVNKFQGDAALAVFGAPLDIDDPAGRALAAARELRERMAGVVDLGYGIGVAYGPVIAGHIGHAQRLEYTVIGDAVNEAARLTDLAKNEPSQVIASYYTVLRSYPSEAKYWGPGRKVELRGRGVPTRLAIPNNIPRAICRGPRAYGPPQS